MARRTETTWELKADDRTKGITLGRLREWLAALDGAPYDTPIKVDVGFRQQAKRMTVVVVDHDYGPEPSPPAS